MGEKGNRKRKRTSVGDIDDEGNTLNQSNVEELLSPKHKSAKRRKQENAQEEKKKDEKKQNVTSENDLEGETKSKVKIKKNKEDVELTKNKKVNTKVKDSTKVKDKKNRKTVEKEKVEKKSKNKKKENLPEDGDLEKSETNDEEKANTSKKKKDKKRKSLSEGNEGSLAEETTPKKKKKDKKSNSFGVVDTKLLKEAGGKVKGRVIGESDASSKINQAIDYLRLWHKNRSEWKFNKRFQIMLIKAAYNPVIINDDDFDTFILYMEDCKGGSRDKLLADAKALVQVEEDHNAESVDPDMERRARQLLQSLG